MARALWLPSVLRAAGLTVNEVPGWQTRGSDSWTPTGIICHATAGSVTATDQAEINVLLTGSATAPAPIAQLYLGRQGHWWVVASGRCNHALTGWGGPLVGLGNSKLLGIEAANNNRGEPWPDVQYDSYARGVAALCRRLGIGVGKVAGHKEHQPPAAGHSSIKTDPTFPMNPFRSRVQQYITGTAPVDDQEEDGMKRLFRHKGQLYIADGMTRRPLAATDLADVQAVWGPDLLVDADGDGLIWGDGKDVGNPDAFGVLAPAPVTPTVEIDYRKLAAALIAEVAGQTPTA